MRILIGCEFSGIVRDAFRARGHDAVSCDLLPSDRPGPHIQDNILHYLDCGWDAAIFHPPCTHLAVSGARWFKGKEREQAEALEFVRRLMSSRIPRWAVENPVSIVSTRIRRPDQIIHPWQFGHAEFKTTCLWLHALPPLVPTNILQLPERQSDLARAWARVHREPPGPDRWKRRSITYTGIADAMAAQWGEPHESTTLVSVCAA